MSNRRDTAYKQIWRSADATQWDLLQKLCDSRSIEPDKLHDLTSDGVQHDALVVRVSAVVGGRDRRAQDKTLNADRGRRALTFLDSGANKRTASKPTHPRILPAAVAALLKSLPATLRDQVEDRITKNASIAGVTSSSAAILGKNYLKQVDVIITDWATGPELLVSTKRMDSSYGKNAPNRIEESYGDAKNLRLRHPLAALGFVFGLRSDILQKEPRTAEWLFDLLAKLGREDDAYHATCLVLMDYADDVALPDTQAEPAAAGILEPGLEPEGDDGALLPQYPKPLPTPPLLAFQRFPFSLTARRSCSLPDVFSEPW